MGIIIEWVHSMKEDHQAEVVCLGLFDGVHLGHISLINEAKQIAHQKGLEVCVHTYDRMPQKLLNPEKEIMELTDLQEKIKLFEGLGVSRMAISRFDEELMHMSGERFFHEVLIQKLNAKHVVVGYDHRFGYKGDTDTHALQKLCETNGIGLSVLPPYRMENGALVSSTAIRNALIDGNMALAEQMLGRKMNK